MEDTITFACLRTGPILTPPTRTHNVHGATSAGHGAEAGVNSLSSAFAEDGFYELPADFDWSSLQYDDGTSFEIGDDSSYLDKARLFALSQALAAAEEGMTIHTLAVGAGADRDLMRAIAAIGGGEYISVSGNLSIQNLQNEVEAGFFRIAALVPPARLANPDEQTERPAPLSRRHSESVE